MKATSFIHSHPHRRWTTATIGTIALIGTLFSCKPDDAVLEAPEISIASIDPLLVVAFENPIEVILRYRDAQGDLGEADPDNPTLRVRDSRLEGDDWYHIPPLTPNSIELSIAGDFMVQIPPLFLLGNGSQESTTLSFQLFDRAGNGSNVVTSETILILDTLR
tara:strand:+ start:1219 stop:1707 length:489 start_codon:yes stop_codon:yes gene_type:complete